MKASQNSLDNLVWEWPVYAIIYLPHSTPRLVKHEQKIIKENEKDETVSFAIIQRNLANMSWALQVKAGLSTCPSVRVTCLSVRVSWIGLSSVRLALGLPQGKLGVTLAYMADTSHSKLAPPKHEHAPRLTHRRL